MMMLIEDVCLVGSQSSTIKESERSVGVAQRQREGKKAKETLVFSSLKQI